MSKLEERALIYIALGLLCSVASVFAGIAVGIWTFVQIASVIELVYLLGGRGSSHRGQEQRF
jgi:F0F1-type ATP synthase membrane subunit c/vacuolar-type H+-ATPase subunit K